jgi:hypothetical protein
VELNLGGEQRRHPARVGTRSQSALAVKAQGGNTTHAPCEFASKLAAHDQGGGGQLLSDISWRVRVPTGEFFLQVASVARVGFFSLLVVTAVSQI